MALIIELGTHIFEQFLIGFIDHAQIKDFKALQAFQIFLGEDALLETLRTAFGLLAFKLASQTGKTVTFNNAQFFIQILTIALERFVNNGVSTSVAFYAFTRKDLNVNHRSSHTGRNTQRRILNVACLFTEDHSQEFFFRG